MSNKTSWLKKPSTRKMRLTTTGLSMLGLLGVAVAAPGCSEDNPLCCNEGDFQVGGTIELEGTSGVALQAVADFAAIASASVDDLTTACRGIAEGLDASAEDRAAAEAIEDKRARMNAYCNLAVDQITAFTAMAQISIDFQPPQCSASVSAKADCQARCSVDGSCDIQANPPTCEGGTLEVSCSGSCTAEAGATLNCTGSCTGGCTGECTAQGGVECQGRCEGTCMGSTDDQGNCQGQCNGTCKATAPGAMCTGTCSGSCDASCEATANASVTCDGSCDADFEPLRCEGGTLSGGCEVEAECDANCDASVSAKAECTPPELTVVVTGGADDIGGKLKVVLEANLGLVAAIGGRLEGMAALSSTFVGNINADLLADIKVACIPVVVQAVGEAAEDVGSSVSATGSVLASVNLSL